MVDSTVEVRHGNTHRSEWIWLTSLYNNSDYNTGLLLGIQSVSAYYWPSMLLRSGLYCSILTKHYRASLDFFNFSCHNDWPRRQNVEPGRHAEWLEASVCVAGLHIVNILKINDERENLCGLLCWEDIKHTCFLLIRTNQTSILSTKVQWWHLKWSKHHI